jgi:serine/threonine protein kinase/Tol biopolymer transport system component
MIGRTLGHYRIEAKLGEGGMGVVYRARDLDLNRPVAIKFLITEAATEDRRRRFQQEAQAASSLNHPHILSVYEAGQADGQQYVIMEYVDGCTLREWAKRKNPSIRQILDLIVGVADALAAAHQAGIVHRDIKPENILVAKAGFAKVVDFGLAKVNERPTEEQPGETLTAGLTQPGIVLGTIAYMAPEQAAGNPVDARSDIFSFGVVLYELFAGQRPFVGKTYADLLHALLHSAPRPLAESRPDTPAELRLIVTKALENDPADRYQSMKEMLVDLRRAQRAIATPATLGRTQARSSGLGWLGWAAVAVSVISMAVALWLFSRPEEWKDPFAEARFTRLTDFEGSELDAAISADGKFVVFLADRDGVFDAWVVQVGGGEFINLTKGQFPELMHEQMPSVGFTPDGTNVWLRISAGNETWLVPTLGGPARPFLKPGVFPAWSRDGKRVVYITPDPAHGEPISIAEPNGGNAKQLFAHKGVGHCHYLTWSPDGRYVYFTFGLPPTDIMRVRIDSGDTERITHHDTRVVYPAQLDDRTLVYVATSEDQSGSWLYSMNLETRMSRRFNSGVAQFISVSANAAGRRLVATVANPSANLWSVPILDQIAEEKDVERFPHRTVRALAPRFGKDFILFLSSRGGADGIWKLANGVVAEIWKGSEGGVLWAPELSPDGRQICFAARKQGRMQLYVMSSEGTGVRALASSLDIQGTASWSSDGQSIAVAGAAAGAAKLFKVPVDGGQPFQLSDQLAYNPLWAPDGSLLFYELAPGGTRRFIKAMTADGKPVDLPQINMRSGGDRVRFVRGGNAVVLLLGEFRRQDFWLLDLKTKRLRQLTRLKPGYTVKGFDITPDGKRIVFDRTRENSDIVLIDNLASG